MTNTVSLADLDVADEVQAICEACDQDVRHVRNILIMLRPQPSSIDDAVDTPPVVFTVEFELER